MTPRLPRDLTGGDLITVLTSLGYRPTRQSGSHVRLATEQHGSHKITIPLHRPLKVGTLSAILGDIARHHEISKADLVAKLFG